MCIQYTSAYVLLQGGNIIEVKIQGSDKMYKIRVNDAFETYGLISASIKKEGENLVTEGMLKTHLYIEDINELECDRFLITGVDVQAEAFGSTDPFVVYYFTFDSMETYYEDLDYDEDKLIELYNKEVNE